MTTLPNSADILVVGAGPVGLYLAAQLHEYSPQSSILVVDRASGPSTLSKALAVHARTLETLAHLGSSSTVARDMVSTAINGDTGAIFGGPVLGDASSGPIGTVAFPPADVARSPYPFGIVRVQSHTEKFLVEDLKRRGVQVAWGTGVTALNVDEKAVTATLSNDEVVKCKYLVACDGGKSTVRHLLEIPFPGHTRSDVFWMADVRIRTKDGRGTSWGVDKTGQVARPWMMASAHGATMVFALQNPHNTDAPVHRIIALGGDEQAAKWHDGTSGTAGDQAVKDTYIDKHAGTVAGVAPPTLAAVERMFNERVAIPWSSVLTPTATRDAAADTQTGYTLSDAHWLTRFTVNERVAASYAAHDARVFLAGDAAHVHSPMGGQGMNLGIQDAHNLAWKLATALTTKTHPRALLATYEQERQPVAQAIVKTTSQMTDCAVRWPWVMRLFGAGNVKLRYPAGHRAPSRGKLVASDGTVAAPIDLYIGTGVQHTVLVLTPHDPAVVVFPPTIDGAHVHRIKLPTATPAAVAAKPNARPFFRTANDALALPDEDIQRLVDSVQLDRVAVPESVNSWVDENGEVAEFLFGVTHDADFGVKDPSQAWVVVVRPDGYMVMAGLGLDADRVREYLGEYAKA
ncbi:hypothetical protein AMAG_13640 [Allomyces macrogynus ATCC 38327]|uniref:FAD-binding domain-containing protein n=1 Tax=Allomyces macrogynus (strain ATCC 38327) TaxID=578462 RepID=A0A0L0T3G1_ALLM3|nr:hypothetical protein AMAG_13640 [Allomyces macrogynus ATCC 38327]|eukprot:KNE69256.1 hypothetical protein AMAG_13640 [Allomyces macrogynus ATCC 38327]